MNNQEAIALLKTLCHTCDLFPECVHEKPECFQAIELAISVLQAQDVTDTNVGDMVSRQKAIDAICMACGHDCDKSKFVYNASQDEQVIMCPEHYALSTLPSAQLEPIRINLNEPIKVKLTDWGKEIYYHQYDRTNKIVGREICKPKFPKEDENGYTEFQLWCFMELYGEHIGMTLPNVIEPLEIVYESEKGGKNDV